MISPLLATSGVPVTVCHNELQFTTTHSLEFIDITDRIADCLDQSQIRRGIILIQSMHTTASILVNENEPLLLKDLRRTLENLAPAGFQYEHDRFDIRTVNMTPEERPNGHAHCKSIFLRTSETIGVRNGRLDLGLWQRIFLVELDESRRRSGSLTWIGAPVDYREAHDSHAWATGLNFLGLLCGMQ